MEHSRSRAVDAVDDLIADAAPEAHAPRFLYRYLRRDLHHHVGENTDQGGRKGSSAPSRPPGSQRPSRRTRLRGRSALPSDGSRRFLLLVSDQPLRVRTELGEFWQSLGRDLVSRSRQRDR
jgi:hypothetical protein